MTLKETIDELNRLLGLNKGEAAIVQPAPGIVWAATHEFRDQRLANTPNQLEFASDWDFARASGVVSSIKRDADLLVLAFVLLRKIAEKHLLKSLTTPKQPEDAYLKDRVDQLKRMRGQVFKATSVTSFHSVFDRMPGVGSDALAQFRRRVTECQSRLRYKSHWDLAVPEYEICLLQLAASMMSTGFGYLDAVLQHRKQGGGCFPTA